MRSVLQNKFKFAKILWRIFTGFILFVFFLNFVFYFFAKQLFLSKINEFISKKSNSLYKIEIKKLRIVPLVGYCQVKDFALVSNPNFLEPNKTFVELTASKVTFFMPFYLFDYFFSNRDLGVYHIEVLNPHITVYETFLDSNAVKYKEKKLSFDEIYSDFYNIFKYVNSLKIRNLNITNLSLSFLSNDFNENFFYAKKATIHVKNFYVDSQTFEKLPFFFKSKDFKISLFDFFMRLKDGNYWISTKKFEISKTKNKIQFYQTTVHPLVIDNVNSFGLSVGNVEIRLYSIDSIFSKHLKIKRFLTKDLSLQINLRSKEPKVTIQKTNFFEELFYNTTIDTFVFQNASIYLKNLQNNFSVLGLNFIGTIFPFQKFDEKYFSAITNNSIFKFSIQKIEFENKKLALVAYNATLKKNLLSFDNIFLKSQTAFINLKNISISDLSLDKFVDKRIFKVNNITCQRANVVYKAKSEEKKILFSNMPFSWDVAKLRINNFKFNYQSNKFNLSFNGFLSLSDLKDFKIRNFFYEVKNFALQDAETQVFSNKSFKILKNNNIIEIHDAAVSLRKLNYNFETIISSLKLDSYVENDTLKLKLLALENFNFNLNLKKKNVFNYESLDTIVRDYLIKQYFLYSVDSTLPFNLYLEKIRLADSILQFVKNSSFLLSYFVKNTNTFTRVLDSSSVDVLKNLKSIVLKEIVNSSISLISKPFTNAGLRLIEVDSLSMVGGNVKLNYEKIALETSLDLYLTKTKFDLVNFANSQSEKLIIELKNFSTSDGKNSLFSKKFAWDIIENKLFGEKIIIKFFENNIQIEKLRTRFLKITEETEIDTLHLAGVRVFLDIKQSTDIKLKLPLKINFFVIEDGFIGLNNKKIHLKANFCIASKSIDFNKNFFTDFKFVSLKISSIIYKDSSSVAFVDSIRFIKEKQIFGLHNLEYSQSRDNLKFVFVANTAFCQLNVDNYLRLKNLEFRNVDLKIDTFSLAKKQTSKESEIKNFTIDTLKINDFTIRYGENVFFFKQIFFEDVNLKDTSSPFFSKNLRFDLVNYQKDIKNIYKLSVKSISGDISKKQLKISGLEILPYENFYDFQRVYKEIFPYRKTVFSVNLANIEAFNFDYATFLSNKILLIDTLKIKGVKLNAYLDRNYPHNFNRQLPNISQYILSLEYPFFVRELQISEFDVFYNELTPKINKNAFVSVDSLRIYGKNITNITEYFPKNGLMRLYAKGSLNKNMDLELILDYDLFSYGRKVKISGQTLKPFDIRILNTYTVYGTNVNFKSGDVIKLIFNFQIVDSIAFGKLYVDYRNLYTTLIKVDTLTLKNRRFLSWIANNFVIRHDNPLYGIERVGEIAYVHDMSYSEFKFWTKAILSGLQSVMIGKTKDYRKIKKYIKIESQR